MNQIRYARFKTTLEFVKRRRELHAFEDMLAELLAMRGPRTCLRFIGAMVADGHIPPLDGARLVEWVNEASAATTAASTCLLTIPI